ncbi:hypothetical protein CR513_57090, partial [Mucuna pruriens]
MPFDEADILRALAVAPTQLHPNGWVMIQAFRLVCHCLRLQPKPSLFLSHYTTRIDITTRDFEFAQLCHKLQATKKSTEGDSFSP